ncbi:MAG: DUF6677 family protein [Acidobacteriota bacterium]
MQNLTEKPQLESAVAAGLPLIAVSKPRLLLAVIGALIIPGLGHVIVGRAARGLIIGLGIILMFILGFVMEGHLFTPVRGEWLTWFFSFLDAGIGLPYFVAYALDLGFKVEPTQAARITFEYGNTFLMVAGALNMLATMDTYDIAIGRKL